MKENDRKSYLEFRLSNIEPEYQRLITDIKENFVKINQKIFEDVQRLFSLILDEVNEEVNSTRSEAIIKSYLEGDKELLLFFSYVFENMYYYAMRNFVNAEPFECNFNFDYKVTDKIISILFKVLL